MISGFTDCTSWRSDSRQNERAVFLTVAVHESDWRSVIMKTRSSVISFSVSVPENLPGRLKLDAIEPLSQTRIPAPVKGKVSSWTSRFKVKMMQFNVLCTIYPSSFLCGSDFPSLIDLYAICDDQENHDDHEGVEMGFWFFFFLVSFSSIVTYFTIHFLRFMLSWE